MQWIFDDTHKASRLAGMNRFEVFDRVVVVEIFVPVPVGIDVGVAFFRESEHRHEVVVKRLHERKRADAAIDVVEPQKIHEVHARLGVRFYRDGFDRVARMGVETLEVLKEQLGEFLGLRVVGDLIRPIVARVK